MKTISSADYEKIKKIFKVLQNYQNERPLRRDEARRQAVLLLRKFERMDSKRPKEEAN